jgi:hypothetical protein
MKKARDSLAFSLIEVIIAIGLFAGAVAIIIGLMTLLSRQAADSIAAIAAQRLPEPLKVELVRLAGPSLDNLASQVPLMGTALDDGFALVAPRDATRVQSLAYLPPATGRLPPAEQFYLVECWRFPSEPLSFSGQKAFLALYVRVSWPYHVPGAATPVALADRNQITFTVSLNR